MYINKPSIAIITPLRAFYPILSASSNNFSTLNL